MADTIELTPLYADETEATILARWRGWANEGLDPSVDVAEWVDTREGAHWHRHVMPGVREFAKVYDLIGTEVIAAGMPVWSWGEYLDDHAEVQTITRLAATPALGQVQFTGAPGTEVVAGDVVGVTPATPDDAAPEYAVTTGGVIPGPLATPTGLAAVGSSGGGTLAAAATFGYKVSAFDPMGDTLATAEVVGTVPSGGGVGKVALTWTAVPGAFGYRVWRGAVGGPYGFLKFIDSPTPSYVDDGSLSPYMPTSPPIANTSGGAMLLPVQATEVGVAGDVGAGAIAWTTVPGVTVSNPDPIEGGTEAETDDALRERIEATYAGQGAGNRADYARWARAWAGVGRAVVIPLWNGPGTVKVILLTADGGPVSAEVVAEVQTDLDPTGGKGDGRAPVGAGVTVETATALAIAVAADITPAPGYSMDGAGGTIALRPDLVAALREYIERVESGDEVVFAKVQAALASPPGVHDVANVLVNGATANVAVSANPARAPQLSLPPALTEV